MDALIRCLANQLAFADRVAWEDLEELSREIERLRRQAVKVRRRGFRSDVRRGDHIRTPALVSFKPGVFQDFVKSRMYLVTKRTASHLWLVPV